MPLKSQFSNVNQWCHFGVLNGILIKCKKSAFSLEAATSRLQLVTTSLCYVLFYSIVTWFSLILIPEIMKLAYMIIHSFIYELWTFWKHLILILILIIELNWNRIKKRFFFSFNIKKNLKFQARLLIRKVQRTLTLVYCSTKTFFFSFLLN